MVKYHNGTALSTHFLNLFTFLGERMSADQIAELTPKGQRTRALILDSALALFAEKGYAATTMRDIAGRAGCSLGLAYRYYARKEDLILAFYERWALELEEEVRA